MAAKHSIIQGDSYALDFKTSKYPTLDANWTGKWAIVTALGSGGSSVASGTLAPSSDFKVMEMRILPADTAAIPEANYTLVVEISNDTLGYRNEVMQESLAITPQGITP